jgi:hypothetical protein
MTRCRRSRTCRTGRTEKLVTAVSPNMKKNYERYGEIVFFGITYNLLKNVSSDGHRYRIGVFCVTDTNIRILMSGIALVC